MGSIGILIRTAALWRSCQAHGIERLYHSFEEILEEEVDTVHLVTRFLFMQKQTAVAFECGKHCAYGTLWRFLWMEIREITEAKRREKLYDDGDYALYEQFLCKEMS